VVRPFEDVVRSSTPSAACSTWRSPPTSTASCASNP